MLLKNLRVRNWRNQILDLPLDAPAGFVVKEIGGLGPSKATLVSSKFAGLDGEQYHTSRREPRNITIKLGLDPSLSSAESVYDLRGQLYDFLMPKTNAKLQFQMLDLVSGDTGGYDREIESIVESLEPDIFAKEPAVDLSLMCFDPDFIDPTPKTVEGSSVDTTATTPFVYSGTVETGVLFKMFIDRSLSDTTRIRLRHSYTGSGTRVFDISDSNFPPGFAFQNGDELQINSVRGAKYVRVIRGGSTINILYASSPSATWIELVPGQNNFNVQVAGASIPYSLTYTDKYGGL